MAARIDDGRPLSAQRRTYVACFTHFIKEARSLTPDEVIPRIRAYAEAGAQEAMLQWFALGDVDGLETLAELVMPSV